MANFMKETVIEFIKATFQGSFFSSENHKNWIGIENCSTLAESIESTIRLGILFLNGKKVESWNQFLGDFPQIGGKDILTIRYDGRTQFYFPEKGSKSTDYDRILNGAMFL